MSMQDPIADMLTRIRNAHARLKSRVQMPHSTLKTSIADVLKSEGYIEDFNTEKTDDGHLSLAIALKYYQGKPVIEKIARVSLPSRRVYKSATTLPVVNNGLGIAVISTSQGVMSNLQAVKKGLGGEVICIVS